MPFGKYAGKPIKELETTYIAHALEKFALPHGIVCEMLLELFTRFRLTEIDYIDIDVNHEGKPTDIEIGRV